MYIKYPVWVVYNHSYDISHIISRNHLQMKMCGNEAKHSAVVKLHMPLIFVVLDNGK